MDAVEMNRATKQSWLEGPGDLAQDTVEDVPVPGQSVLVRGLPAQYSNEATSQSLELRAIGGEQKATVNTARLEVLQFAHGCVDPQFTIKEAEQIAKKYGPAFKKVVNRIDELSGVDKEALEKAEVRFPVSDAEQASEARPVGAGNGASAGSGGPDVRPRVGPRDGEERS